MLTDKEIARFCLFHGLRVSKRPYDMVMQSNYTYIIWRGPVWPKSPTTEAARRSDGLIDVARGRYGVKQSYETVESLKRLIDSFESDSWTWFNENDIQYEEIEP